MNLKYLFTCQQNATLLSKDPNRFHGLKRKKERKAQEEMAWLGCCNALRAHRRRHSTWGALTLRMLWGSEYHPFVLGMQCWIAKVILCGCCNKVCWDQKYTYLENKYEKDVPHPRPWLLLKIFPLYSPFLLLNDTHALDSCSSPYFVVS